MIYHICYELNCVCQTKFPVEALTLALIDFRSRSFFKGENSEGGSG